jgi:hypothetical protein
MTNTWLLAGGILSGVAAGLHVACIFGGPSWYRFFGAGERFARAAERGSPVPPMMTLVIAAGLAIWSWYGLSGAGYGPSLPWLRTGLTAIAAVYLARAAALPVMLKTLPDRTRAFLVWSSVCVLVIGLAYGIGVAELWLLSPTQRAD